LTFDSDPILLKPKQPWRTGDRVQSETVVPPVFGKEFELRPSRREALSVGFFVAGVRLLSAGFFFSPLGFGDFLNTHLCSTHRSQTAAVHLKFSAGAAVPLQDA